MQLEAWIRDTNRQKGDETGVKIRMRENRVATVETSNLSEFALLKSQIDTIGKQFATFLQHVSAQAVTPMSAIPPAYWQCYKQSSETSAMAAER